MATVQALIRGSRHVIDLDDVRDRAGAGGEAVVKIIGGEAVKIHFTYNPDLAAKLSDAPKGAPANVIMPGEPVTDATDPRRVLGFTMRLIKDTVPISMFGDADFQRQYNLTWEKLVRILLNLHDLVTQTHKAGIIFGDFNEKNVLVNPRTLEVFIVDMDAAWWGRWTTLTYTLEFTDVRLLKKNTQPNQSPVLIEKARYTQETDWYAYAAMVCKVLLGGTPYRDGTHKPKNGQPMQRLNQRVLSRLSFFDTKEHIKLPPEIRHPALLPAGLGRFLHDMFVEDRRETPFPRHYLETYVQMTCPKCGCEHGRAKCPKCGAAGITTPTTPYFKPGQRLNGHVPGSINILATYPFGEVQYVHHTGGAYRREDGSVVLRRPYSPSVTALVAGKRTVLIAGQKFAIFDGGPGVQKKYYATQSVMGRTTVAANSRYVYWMNGNNLVRNDPLRSIAGIGPSPTNQTSVWVGERFGVTLVTEPAHTRVQIFTDNSFRGTLDLPDLPGTIVGADCVVGDRLAWLKITCQNGRERTTTILVVDANAGLLATALAEGSTAYLARLTPTALAAGNAIYLPVEGLGIVQFAIEYGTIRMIGNLNVVTSFQDTVGFCLNSSGLVHVTRTAISHVVKTS
jgi:hypothetical protein